MSTHCRIVLWTIFLSSLSFPLESYLLSGGAVCFGKCNCVEEYVWYEYSIYETAVKLVRCEQRDLTSIPNLSIQNLTNGFYSAGNKITIDMRDNQIQTVPDRAFGDLPNLSDVDIFGIILYNNSISSVSNAAFLGLENTTVVLDLGLNNLTTIPQALRILRKLLVLEIEDNPIFSLDASMIQHISPILDFSINLTLFNSWPVELNNLYVKVFWLFGFPGNALQNFSVHGFNQSGIELTVEGTEIIDLSDVICNDQLDISKLFVYSNYKIDIRPFERCSQGRVMQNLLEFELDNIKVTRIPNFIHTMTTLQWLAITGTNISEIYSNDFRGLTELEDLYLNNSRIEIIHQHAFDTNTKLRYLNLKFNMLESIPDTVVNMQLDRLDFSAINCTCSNLQNLKQVDATFAFDIPCLGNTQVVKDALAACP